MESEKPTKSSEPTESCSSLPTAPSLSTQFFYSYKEPEKCQLSFRSLSPSYTSRSLPFCFFNSFSSSEPIRENSRRISNCSLFALFQSFYFSGRGITSLYESEPSPTEIVCAMSEWKDTQTISGLIVRATEQNPYIRTLEKFQILFLLAFASTSFLIKFVCVISERDTCKNPIGWLLKFIDVVENALSDGLPEETFLDDWQQEELKQAYEKCLEMNSGFDDEDQCELFPVASHPYWDESYN
jgi:hypothetical protein